MSKTYIIRLDDASEKRNIENWNRIEQILDSYNIKPIVGLIPKCEDKDMEKYPIDPNYASKVQSWQQKGWIMAMHGFNHVFTTEEGGLNPVNNYSEFAGVPLDIQKEKIKNGLEILKGYGVEPKIFFAPAHTYDNNTLIALKECSAITHISDTVANDVYLGDGGFTYIPQQSGRVRKLPFKTTTFCYHPNNMQDDDFEKFEKFCLQNLNLFAPFCFKGIKRKRGILDYILHFLYFIRRK